MKLWIAAVLLILAIVGIILSVCCLRQKKALRTVLIVLLGLIALALAVYIGLTILFVSAVENQPPV